MSFSKLFPCALAALFAAALTPALTTRAQTAQATRPRQAGAPQQTVTATDPSGRTRLENDLTVPYVVGESGDEEEPAAYGEFSRPKETGLVERLMFAAIEERLGVPYRLGSEGPNRYDCSGFVWSVFQQAGVDFERGSARTFWSRFEPAGEADRYKFGTLVFFNNLRHVGIVADAEGFYHASTSRGVVYSRFGDYWSKRISGFRRVPLPRGAAPTLVASAAR